MRTLVFVTLGLLIGCTVCKKSTEPEIVSRYPHTAGDSWKYTGVDSGYNFRPDTAGRTYTLPLFHTSTQVEILGSQLVQGKSTLRMQSTTLYDPGFRTYSGSNYYLLKAEDYDVL